MTEQHETPLELSDPHGGDAPAADARRRRLLAAGAKGLFAGPIIVTLANRPAFGLTSNCNFSAGGSVNPSQAKVQGGDKSDVWYGRSTWPSDVGCAPGSSFVTTFGISSYWNVSSTSYVKVGGVQNASFALQSAVSTSGTDGNVVYWAKKSGNWHSFNIGLYCSQATAAYLNEMHYKTSFPLVGVKSMVQADFAKFAASTLTSENTSNYNSFVRFNDDCP
jgi:hypothetical protein